MAVFETLRTGSRGPLTELLQLGLTRAGYTPGRIDGVFGSRTYNAVLRFQRNSGLAADGIVGGRTWNALTPWLTGYTTHTVRRGDTFYRLSQTYNTTISALETANPAVDPLSLRIGETLTVPLSFDVVPTNISFTSTVMELAVQGLRARYPFLVTGSAGKSVSGKPLYYIKIGQGERQVFYNGAHHANEWITAPLLMKFLEKYAYAYSRGGEIFNTVAEELYNTASLYLIPLVNPDGVDLVTGQTVSGSRYDSAKAIAGAYPAIPFPSGWKANIIGTDLNLQYPAGWEQAKAIKFAQGYTSPAPRDYVGSAPLSAVESRAVYDFTRTHDFRLTISYHTQGEVIYWKYADYQPENSLEIARQFASVSGYAVETTPTESGYAGYKDWYIMTYNRPGYTIEVGRGENPLPIADFDRIYEDNLGILVLGLIV